jgi:AraC-like DNA-binding protein
MPSIPEKARVADSAPGPQGSVVPLYPSLAYASRIREVISAGLPSGEAKASRVARLLGTTRRTLHARLARGGLNYSTVLQSVRCELSRQYLSGGRSITDVAGLVGFESLSAFTQWFRRTFACTPSSWRVARRDRETSKPLRRPCTQDAKRQRAIHDSQVPAAPGRIELRARRADPHTSMDVAVEAMEAFAHARVDVFHPRQTGGTNRFHKGTADRRIQPCATD